MATKHSIEVTCPACGNGQAINTYSVINATKHPELKAAVKDGSFFLWECPHCGKRNLVPAQLLYHDPAERLMFWLVPKGVLSAQQEENIQKALEARFDDPANGLDGYTLRRVDDAGSLIEKVNIHDAGLDDVVMEMAKWVTRNEMAEKDRDHAEEILKAPFKFFRMDGADNEILLSFPLGGAMQVVNIGFNVYEDCRGIVQRNPSMKPQPGFDRVDADWIARFLQ